VARIIQLYTPTDAEHRACRVAALSLALLEQLPGADDSSDGDVRQLASAAHILLPVDAGFHAADADGFAARVRSSRDLVIEASVCAEQHEPTVTLLRIALASLQELSPDRVSGASTP
jgi:hypothetical protein